MKKAKTAFKCLLLLFFFKSNLFGQSPGIIVRPAGGNGITVLNPNGDSWSSATTSGFIGSDITTSEILYKVVPPAVTEPTGDLATGPSGGFTDIVKSVDGSGFYIYYDGTNILLRLRIGGIISGSKGYSILFDTDGKIGNSGPYADPNYIAGTNTSNGNPGFEFEVVLQTNFAVAVYNVDGTSNPGSPIATYSLNTNSQISVALSTDSGNPDYFYDFYVPVSIIGSPTSFRMVATTVTSPSSALQGSRSDIYGIDDAANSNVSSAWQTVINSQPTISLTDISSGGSGVGSTCTAAPTINSPITTGSNISVSGTWTRMDVSKPSTATITLYKNGSSAGTYSATTGGAWNIIVPIVSVGDIFYAKAQSSGESQCLQSSSVTAGCTSTPSTPVLTCASSKGISGNISSGNTVLIYLLPTTSASPTSNPLTTNITYPTSTTFAFYQSSCSGGSNNVADGSYMVIATNGSCISGATFVCVTSGSASVGTLANNGISLTTPIYPYQTSISGTGSTNGQVLRLFINGKHISSTTASGTSFSFSGLTLYANDQIQIYSQSGTACVAVSNTFVVSCYTQPPSITTNTAGNLLTTSTSVSGTSAYIGATVSLYKGISPSGTLVGTSVVNSSGIWTVSSFTLTAPDSYYATQIVNSCTSAASSAAIVSTVTTVCPTITGATYNENSTSIAGTTPSAFTGTIRLYLDGTAIASTTMSGGTAWSIPVNQNTTTYIDKLYAGGILTVTSQASGAAEKTDCVSSSTISCTAPTTPVISPTSTTIVASQTVTFTVQNAQSGMLFSIRDNSDANNLGLSKFGAGSNLTLTSTPFNSPGLYTVRIKSTSFSGVGCESYTTASITVTGTLPVNLISFNAKPENNVVRVTWKSSSEINLSGYAIEKSYDGINFVAIGNVTAGNYTTQHDYNFIDHDPGASLMYYRLKTVDLDGTVSYSKIVTVKMAGTFIIEKVTPNPFKDKIEITLNSAKEAYSELRITDIQGRIILSEKRIIQKGKNTVIINLLDKLSSGMYILDINANDEKISYKLLRN